MAAAARYQNLQTVPRVKRIEDPPLSLLIPGSMSLPRPAPAKRHLVDRHRRQVASASAHRAGALLQYRRSRQPVSRPRARAGVAGRHRRLSHPSLIFVMLDELGYLPVRAGRRPVAVPPDQPALRAHLDHRHHQSRLRRMVVACSATPKMTTALARPPHASLRHRRDRQRKLALQEPRLTVQTRLAPHRTALAPAAQPRPAPPRRALPSAPFTRGFWTPILGPFLAPIENFNPRCGLLLHADHGRLFGAD